MATFVKYYILYFKIKTSRITLLEFFKLLKIFIRPWIDILIDYIINLSKYPRNEIIYKYILVVINRLTKIHHFISITNFITKKFIKIFFSIIYKLYKILDSIVLDRDIQFIFDF